jgi:hypothetical protein
VASSFIGVLPEIFVPVAALWLSVGQIVLWTRQFSLASAKKSVRHNRVMELCARMRRAAQLHADIVSRAGKNTDAQISGDCFSCQSLTGTSY